MTLLLSILLLGTLCSVQCELELRHVAVTLDNGFQVIGIGGPDDHTFSGIPYAKAPVGELRFADPQQPDQMEKNFYALAKPKVCVQMNFLLPNPVVEGSEDCLFLNIYRPNRTYTKDTKLDVMVYIHGGGFFSGSSDMAVKSPRLFMEENSVILVTIQYRLSVLGFLSTGDESCPGNFGLKDQTVALRYIKNNIRAFGGNPDSITIFGEGAGAASVQMHMMSPLSRGLFHKVIAMSGSAIAPWNYPTPDPLELARKLAKVVGMKGVNQLSRRGLVDPLREVKAEDLISSVAKLKDFAGIDPLTLFRPVVEPKTVNGAFLTEDPSDMLERGDFANVPFMTGVVEVEGAVRGAAILKNKTQLKELNSRMDELLPKLLEITITGDKLKSFIQKVKQRYLNGLNVIDHDNKYTFLQMYTDYSFYYPMYKSLPHMVNRIPVYVYKFSYRGEYSYSQLYTGTDEDYGAVHCDDLIYLFASEGSFRDKLYEEDKRASRKLISTYIAFAKQDQLKEHHLKKCHHYKKNDFCAFIDIFGSFTQNPEHHSRNCKNPICEYVHFYNNKTAMGIKNSHEFDLDMVKLWDELKA